MRSPRAHFSCIEGLLQHHAAVGFVVAVGKFNLRLALFGDAHGSGVRRMITWHFFDIKAPRLAVCSFVGKGRVSQVNGDAKFFKTATDAPIATVSAGLLQAPRTNTAETRPNRNSWPAQRSWDATPSALLEVTGRLKSCASHLQQRKLCKVSKEKVEFTTS